MDVYVREKWTGFEPREFGKSGAKRNRKLKLVKGSKKREDREGNLTEGEIFKQWVWIKKVLP